MKFNLKVISLILILFFISVSAVCAQDSAQTDDINATETDMDSIDEVQTNDIYSASQPKGFHELQEQIWRAEAGSTIELDCDYVSDNVREWDIGINKQLTIDGKGHTLDGKNSQGIFTVSEGVTNVVIKNVNFINGVRNCGAAIHAYKGANNLIVDNCTFKNNKATTDNVGGAILVTGNNCKITNCYFENNVARTSGGAIRIEGDSATISNNIFIGNKATDAIGGAINALGHKITITGNTFTKNTAGRDGGAVCVEGTRLEEMTTGTVISKNVFDSNKVSGSPEGCHGGAISMAGENCEISYNNFTKNHADDIGGAIRWNGANSAMGSILGNIFESNDAVSGGAIYIAGHGIKISKNTFRNNKVTTGAGGTINIKGNNAVISDNEITNSNTKAHGGAIYIEGKNIQLKNDTLTKCTAGDNGGGAYLYGSGSVTDCTFTSCSATSYGGGVFFKNTDFTLRGNTFKSDTAGKGGNNYWPTDIPSGKIKTTLTAKYDSASKNIVATVKDEDGNPVSGLKVGFAIDGVKYVVSDEKGQAKYSTSGLAEKKYSVNVIAYGNNIYDDSNKVTVTFDLTKIATTLTAPDVTAANNSGKKLVVTLKDANGNVIKGAKVKITLGNATETLTTDAKGQVSLSTDGLVPNTYTATIIFEGNDVYKKSSTTAKVTITDGERQRAKIYLRNALYFVLQTKYVTVTLWDANNNPIAGKTVYINLDEYGLKYSGVTDENGNAYIRVGVGFGNHPATVSFEGDDQYNSDSKTGRVRVIKETPSLMLPGAYTKFKATDKTKTIKVYLKDRYNKPLLVGTKVFVTINGRQYVGLTDLNGIATINLENLNKAGVYNVDLYYTGNTAYNAVRRSTDITIV